MLAFGLSSCFDFTEQSPYYVDYRLKNNVEAIITISLNRERAIQTDGLGVIVGKINTSGLCEKKGNRIIITINESFFKDGAKPDSLALTYMLAHEFGHAIGRGHNDKYSIMNPNKYAGEFHNDENKRKLLFDELFSF